MTKPIKTPIKQVDNVLEFMTEAQDPASKKLIKSTKPKISTTASTALLAQTIQKIPNEQTNIFELFKQDQETQRMIEETNIEEIGANLSSAGYRALLGVLRACSYGGAYTKAQKKTEANPTAKINETINIPYSDYAKLTGETKIIKTLKEKTDFSSGAWRTVAKGLEELAQPVAQVYSIPAKSGKKGLRDAVRVVEPLITYQAYYEDLTDKQIKTLKEQDGSTGAHLNGKIKMLQIKPSPIFFRSSFANIPETLLDKLEALYGKRAMTPALYKLIIILALEVNRRGVEEPRLVRRLDKLLANIGKYNLVQTRQIKRAKKELKALMDKLIEVKAVDDYQLMNHISGQQMHITINAEAFDRYETG